MAFLKNFCLIIWIMQPSASFRIRAEEFSSCKRPSNTNYRATGKIALTILSSLRDKRMCCMQNAHFIETTGVSGSAFFTMRA